MTQPPTYGPHNPYPLSQMKTELVWEGKYDEYGNRREVDIAGCAMSMQKIESIDEPRRAAAAEGQLGLFEQQNLHQDDFRNRLIWGDNKLVMASLLKEFRGKVDLIYIDPPFDVGADFTMKLPIGEEEAVEKEQSTLEMIAYRDIWGKGTDSYLHMITERITLMKELLSDAGSIYIHCDWRMNSFLRVAIYEIFNSYNFRNEIIWHYPGREMHISSKFNAKHDTILFYSKSERNKIRMDQVSIPYDREERLKTLRRKVHLDEDGREWVWETRGQAAGQEPYKQGKRKKSIEELCYVARPAARTVSM